MNSKSSEVEYKLPKLGTFKWVLYIGLTFFLSFLFYFPLMKVIESQIQANLATIPNCAISPSSIEINYFPPGFRIPKTNIPQSCFKQLGEDLVAKNTKLLFRGFTFSPFGPHFKLETNFLSNNINALVTTGLSVIKVNIPNNKIKLSKLNKVIKAIKLGGDLKLNSKFSLSNGKLIDLKLSVQSKNFALPPQSISGFKISNMPLKTLSLLAQMDKAKVKVKNFVLGDKESPIRANFKGVIRPNLNHIPSSLADLKGEVAFSKSFVNEYKLLINAFMTRFDKKDNFYQIEMKGSFNGLQFESPRK